MENYLIIVIIAYILLGLHSAYFFIRRYTLHYDFRIDGEEMIQLALSFLLPIVTHLATCVTYSKNKSIRSNKILFKKRVGSSKDNSIIDEMRKYNWKNNKKTKQ